MKLSLLAGAGTVAALLPLTGCQPSAREALPTAPSRSASAAASAAANPSANGKPTASPQESAVLAAMANFKQAILDSDVAELALIWTDDYTIINPQGGIANKAQRLANLSSGNTNIDVIDNEREITVSVYGDMAVVQNLSTLHGHFNGVQTDTDLRGTFVWVRRDGRWRLVTDQLTPVVH